MDLKEELEMIKKARMGLSQEEQARLEEDFVIKMVYHSNAMEGNPMSLAEVRAVLDE